MNASNIFAAFATYKNSFNVAIRFVWEAAQLTPAEIPAAPAKEDKSDAAETLRKEARAAKKRNTLIEDCKQICKTFGLGDEAPAGAKIKELRNAIVAKAPYVDVNGNVCKLAKLPAYLKDELTNYKDVFTVAPASWIEVITLAASNKTGKQISGLNITEAPKIEEGEIIAPASGDLVDAAGKNVSTLKIFAAWDRLAKCKNIANSEGRAVADATFERAKNALKSKK